MSAEADKVQLAAKRVYLRKLTKRYLKKNGTVDPSAIIWDIRFHRLSRADVELLLTDSRFEEAFQGKGFIKHPQEYLDNMQDGGIHGKMIRQRHCGDEWIPLPRSQWTRDNFDNVCFDFGISGSANGISKEVLLYFAEMGDSISSEKSGWSIWESLLALGMTMLANILYICTLLIQGDSVSNWNIAACAVLGCFVLGCFQGYVISQLADAIERKKKGRFLS